jgi:predicted nuclease of restriction endonuclease-like (RecB) superfamily
MTVPMSSSSLDPDGYAALLAQAKAAVRDARLRAHLAVNREVIHLYWQLGRLILSRQKAEGWGTRVVERLSADLRAEFPDMKGLSRRNLMYMRALAEAWPEIVQQPVAQLPWGHITVLLDRLDDHDLRQWYAEQAVENGWSRNVLLNQIMSELHRRLGAAPSNFARTLPAAESDLVQQITKDPYNLEFLGLGADVAERKLEDALVAHLQRFLLELGAGFAFVGRQYRLEVGGDEFFADLLFYHLRLRRYIVIELKTGKFKPEYAGQLNFYVNGIDDLLRGDDDRLTVGILLCATHDEAVVRYALHSIETPMAVAGYRYRDLPAEVRAALPEETTLDATVRSALDAAERTTPSD